MDIKVNASNEIEKYPYTFTNLKKDYPKISFTKTSISDPDVRQQYGILEVKSVADPADDTKTSVEVAPVWDGSQWVQTWETTDLTAEELTAIANKPTGTYNGQGPQEGWVA